jgi:hypothetical protein
MARDLKANLHAMGRDSMPSAKRRMNKDNDVVKTNMQPPVNLPPAMPFPEREGNRHQAMSWRNNMRMDDVQENYGQAPMNADATRRQL